MKKTFAYAACGLCFGTLVAQPVAFAQSSVTLYGKIDTGLTYVSNEGGAHNYRADDSKMYGNRWGLLGTEDLGNGLKAVFRLENGFALNTGKLKQGGAEFGRQAYVGLSNDWGTLTFGNQYDFTNDYLLQYNISAFATGYLIHQGDFDRVGGDRLQNAVKFSSADFKGISFGGMYSFSNRAGDFHNGSAWSAGANYANGPVGVSVAYTRLNQPNGLAALDPYAAIGVTQFLGQTVATRDPVTGAVTDLFADLSPGDGRMLAEIGACGEREVRTAIDVARRSFDAGVWASRGARTAAAGIFYNAGQMCTAASRLLVHADIYDIFMQAVVDAAAYYVPGDPLDPATTMGAIVDEPHLHKVLGYVACGRDEASLRIGGRRVREASGGLYIEPTVFERARVELQKYTEQKSTLIRLG
jgi:hypothetical protein